MLYNKYRRQWLAFVIVVVGRRRYRGRVGCVRRLDVLSVLKKSITNLIYWGKG